MSDIDELRHKRMQELQQQAATNENQQAQNQIQQQMQQEMEVKKKNIMMQILTSKARSRLVNIRLTKPELVDKIELQLIQLAQSGKMQDKITDEQLKSLLRELSGQKRDINIIRK